jgi:hypothetical protein
MGDYILDETEQMKTVSFCLTKEKIRGKSVISTHLDKIS